MAHPTLNSRTGTARRKGDGLPHRTITGVFQPARFWRDEGGAVVAFTLFMLFLMLIAGGVAIDVMRQEMQRARLQNTLDTAVLAAAGATYSLNNDESAKPKAIVQDYMAKADMASYLDPIDDDGEGGDDDILYTLNASRVTASAQLSMDTLLMRLSGVKQLGAVAASSAERRVPKLEVAMVLDVSGSMGSNRKLRNLKNAGKEFVTTILNSSEAGDAVISLVPFSWDVAPGPGIFNALNVDVRHNYSTCLQFSDDDFDSAAIDPDTQQTQLIYTSDDDWGLDNLNYEWRTCDTDAYAEILPYSSDETALHNKFDALQANGNTSGNMGMKWGSALLDPKFQSVKLAIDGNTDVNAVSSVPAAYNEAETLKVIVMMGDGQNTYSNAFPLDSQFRGEDSFLHKFTYEREKETCTWSWVAGWTCTTSMSTVEDYYLYDYDSHNYDSISSNPDLSVQEFDDLKAAVGEDGYEQFTWEEAWGRITPDMVGDVTGYREPDNQFTWRGRVSGSDKDDQMADVCTAIKNKGVVVYTIGFEIDQGGNAETQLKKCASSDVHYFRAEGVTISDAFASIASNVVNLRLTQ